MAKEAIPQVIPEEIRNLLAQRQTYQGWLTRLEGLSGEFRPEVTGRVRSDYQDRLGHVESELAGHRAVLESSLLERRANLEVLLERHDERTAELEECELRHKVGEYDEREWERRRGEHQSVLDELQGGLGREREAVGELERVLSELSDAPVSRSAGATSSPAAPREAAEASERSASPVPDAEEAEAAAEPIASEAHAPAGPYVPDRDAEVAEAQSTFGPKLYVSGEETERSTAPARRESGKKDSGDGSAVVEVVEDADFMDELEFLESISLDDAETFDAVSAMLDEEGSPEGSSEADDEGRVSDL